MTNVYDIFTPNSQPTITYFDRGDAKIEQNLREALEKPNSVVSLSGPSKSGKTVLIRKVVPEDLLITVSGASIHDENELWQRVLAWMETPETITTTDTKGSTVTGGLETTGEGNVPLIAKATATASVGGERSSETSKSATTRASGLPAIVREIGGSDFVIFLDDFHYIPKDKQSGIARNIKAVAEAGVKICTASVPHRSDDVVRANPELRGRLAAIDFTYWSEPELEEIAQKGFAALNVVIQSKQVKRLASESIGSPQLMQALCLNLCLEKDIKTPYGSKTHIEVTDKEIEEVLERTSALSDFSSLLESLHSGPRKRGTERKEFQLSDNSTGDVYRTILLAIKQNPLSLSMNYEGLMGRIRSVCKNESPAGSSVTQALKQMEGICNNVSPSSPILEWDEDVLDIVEPYFLFYLRCSPRLSNIGSRRAT